MKSFYWDGPYLLKYCSDQISKMYTRKRGKYGHSILSFWSMQCPFFFKTDSCKNNTVWILLAYIIKYSHAFCKVCKNCQMVRSISKRNTMPLNLILVIEIFDCLGIDFMGPFSISIWICIHFGCYWLCFKMDRGDSLSAQWSQDCDPLFKRKYFEQIWNTSSHYQWWR